MTKKRYIVPTIKVKATDVDDLLLVDSKLNADDDNPNVIPTDDPFDGEFGANGNNIWDE